MATQALVDQQRQVVSDVVTLATSDLVTAWGSFDTADARGTQQALTATVTDLSDAYGGALAGVTADWYDEVRADAPVRGAYTAAPGELSPAVQIDALAGWAVGPLFAAEPDADLALARAAGGLQRMVANTARSTVLTNLRSDPQGDRWYRGTSAKPCAFCSMLASRGDVYRSESTADFKAHNHCHCIAVPLFRGESVELPSYYDDFAKAYTQAVERVGSASMKPVLAEMRTILGVR